MLCHAPRFFDWLDSRGLCFSSEPDANPICGESSNRTALDGDWLLRAFLSAPHEEDYNGRTVSDTIRWTKADLGYAQVCLLINRQIAVIFLILFTNQELMGYQVRINSTMSQTVAAARLVNHYNAWLEWTEKLNAEAPIGCKFTFAR